MNRQLLEKPFDSALVETRPGRFGKELSFVPTPAYVERLNEAFDGEWSFEIDDHHVIGGHVVVLATLTAGGVTKSAFGGSPLVGEDGVEGRLADVLEAASMDALRKACSLLGLGLHLYENATRREPGERRIAGAPRPLSPGAPPATARQRRAIDAIARALGWSHASLHELCLDVTGAPLGHLNRRSASKLISAMQQLTVEQAA